MVIKARCRTRPIRLSSALFFLSFLSSSVLWAQQPMLVFPQIADGDGIRSEIILTNPGSEHDIGTIFFRDGSGNPLLLSFGGAVKSEIPYSIPPGGLLRLQSDGTGGLKTGYATIISTNAVSEIAGSIVYDLKGFEVSIPTSPVTTQFHVFAERDATANSGIAVANPGDQAITISLQLLDEQGNVLEQESLPLPARRQLPRFIDELFENVPSTFRGSVKATSSSEFALVGLRQKTSGSLAVLSASADPEPVSSLIFTQLADGGGIQSEIVVVNSGQSESTGTVVFRDPLGSPLALRVGGVSRSSIPFSISAGGVFKLKTDGDGGIKVGYARVIPQQTNSFINGNIIYALSGFEVSVPNSPLSEEYHVLVERSGSARSGIALANVGSTDVVISTELLDENGQFVDRQDISLPRGQHMARFVDEIYTSMPAQFLGTLHLRSENEFSLVGLRQRSNLSLSTLSSSRSAVRPPAVQSAQGDYWLSVDLPELTSEQRTASCSLSEQELQAFRDQQVQEARTISTELEDYIRAWLRGEVPAQLPKGLLPSSMDNEKTHSWKLLRPEEVKPEDQWFFYPARKEPALDNFQNLYLNNAATHVTYLKLIFLAPFDSKLLIEGDFPDSREMSFHILGPLDPEFPITSNMGIMEVPIIDVDINPDPGHVNPFRVGADRNATSRHYHVTFDLKEGNVSDLNPVMRDPHFRAAGNNRVGGPMAATGGWGNGVIVPSLLWLRYYAPDLNSDGTVDPLAGVPLPKALLQLDTGEQFWLQSNLSLAEQRQLTTAPGATTLPVDPITLVGPSLGWFKMYGILLMNAEARGYQIAQPFGPLPPMLVKAGVRAQMACLFNQGPREEPPGDIAHSATDMPYNNYLVRPFFLGPGKVYAMTGRLPTTPRTRNGEATLQKAEARYWSLCHTGDVPAEPVPFNSLGYGCLMDDEITTNASRDYIIVYSRALDRPSNATAQCGVTWQNFGPQARQSFVLRWMSVFPDHYMENFAPTDENIPWEVGSWSEPLYNQALVGQNKAGAMGPYHPVIHYLDKTAFEALGCPVNPDSIPQWK